MKRLIRYPSNHIFILLGMMLLTACGGGGGGGSTGGTGGGGTTTTPPPVLPTASVPLDVGRKWLYDFNRNLTWVCSTCGVNSTNFAGEVILHVEGQTTWQGRQAWKVIKYELESSPSGDDAFDVDVEYLVQDSNGLERWYSGLSQWKRILSNLASSFGTNTLQLTREPNSSSITTLSQTSISVPIGSYSAVRANAKYREGFTTFATLDHDEDHSEYYVDGIGLVKSTWDFWFDDNDPGAVDVFEIGSAELKAMDTGPFPNIVVEVEANNTDLSSQSLPSSYAIVAGNVHISDTGGITSNTNVFPNINNVRKIEDWYTFQHPGGSIRLDMRFDSFDNINSTFNDLDVYLFRRGSLGQLIYINRSTNDPTVEGDKEWIIDSQVAGTYLIGVQAWNTPTTRVDYWFVIR